MVFENVMVGFPLVKAHSLFAKDERDWSVNEFDKTLFTETRFLPKIMVEAGIVSSTSEVRRNRKDLVVTLDKPDFFMVKWGKRRLFIAVGIDDPSEDG